MTPRRTKGKSFGAAKTGRSSFVLPRGRAATEALFRLAVEAAPNAMVMADANGRIVLINAQAEKLFGYSRSELLGQNIEILVPRAARERHARYRTQFCERPETRSMGAGRDLFGMRKDGTEISVEIGLNPIKTEKGIFVMASIIDISERKRLEKKLSHTQALAAVGGMVAQVAHEIRNPLGSIAMAAKALARQGLSPKESAQVLAILKSESERLNRTLSDFLEFAKPREPRLQPGDLNGAAREVLQAVKSDERLIGAAIVSESWAENLPAVPFDADQIRQVLWNIVRNGLQAMKGKGRLQVRTEIGQGEALILIEDSGPGIPRQDLEKIFTPFHTTKPAGTGLGLSISRSIVLAHGGDIRIQSTPGKGTRFSIVLPLPG